ncbi:MAG: thiosulfate oxidation carrier protein SoxY [Hyphomonadaceae bacterium]|nr:thiosulfate oxidation carrier protein SoxY [Hyphomonadaceae bacterium]
MDKPLSRPTDWTRRGVIAAGTAAMSLFVPGVAEATPDDLENAIRDLFGDRPLSEGRVVVGLPPIAENGNSVALNISVDSPMTPEDHVRQIVVLSPRNPIATLAQFRLSPSVARADISTRVRLAGTQTVRVVAEISDGSLWTGKASTYVTLAACVIG